MKKIVIMLIGIIFITGCGCDNKKNVDEIIKENVQQEVVKDQSVDVFNFTNTSLTYQKNTTLFVTKVTNTSSETQYLKQFKIHVWGKDGKEIRTLTGFVGSSFEPNESKIINSSCGEDLTNASRVTYEIIR